LDCSGTVRVFRQKYTLEDAIGSHACSLEANMRVTNGILLGCPLLLPVDAAICVQTLKAIKYFYLILLLSFPFLSYVGNMNYYLIGPWRFSCTVHVCVVGLFLLHEDGIWITRWG
jgi:hypothetical protein